MQVRAHTHRQTDTQTRTHAHTYTRTHTHTHAHTHTHTPSLRTELWEQIEEGSSDSLSLSSHTDRALCGPVGGRWPRQPAVLHPLVDA